MGRITTVSLFVAICFIGVTYGMDCAFGGSPGVIGTLLNTCPSLLSSSTASYCCLRPNRFYLECCEAGEFFGVLFGAIFVFALFVGCCCCCCACCPCYHFCRRNSTNVAVIDASGYQGNNRQNQDTAMAMQNQYRSPAGYTRA